MENTHISWADDTFNPWEGCQKTGSPACEGCYAEARNLRYAPKGSTEAPNWGPHAARRRTSASNWAKPLKWEREQAVRVEDRMLHYGSHPPARFVFCASLADVFDNAIPMEWRSDLFELIHKTPHLTWLLLTKRPQNIERLWFKSAASQGWPKNAAIGCTVVTQAEADRDIPHLLRAKHALNPAFAFLSMEPLMEMVDISPWLGNNPLHGGVEEQRGFRLSGGLERQAGNTFGRHDMATISESLGPSGKAIGQGWPIFSGGDDDRRNTGLRPGSPFGLSPLQGRNSSGHDGQPRGRPKEAESSGQLGIGHSVGTANPRQSSAGNRGRSEPSGREQSSSQDHGRAGDGDTPPPILRGTVAINSGHIRYRDADGLQDRARGQTGGIDWCIDGGETDQGQHKARPSHPDWFRSIRDQCAAAGVPYHHKQNGEWIGLQQNGDGFWPTDKRGHIRLNIAGDHTDDGWPMQRVGKKHAGRLLDGVIHDARPDVP